MTSVTLYHNPRCSKSRQTLALLEEQGITPDIVFYLETQPDEGEIRSILTKLDASPRDIIRTGEAEYKDMNLSDTSLTDDDLVAAIAKAPKLLQRPIVIKGNDARIGRPPEAVLEIL